MKRYKLLGLSVLLISICSISACASKPTISNSDISSENEITFNKKTYSLAYNCEFNDDVVPPEFTTFEMDLDENGGHWYDRDKHSIGKVNSPSLLYVKDGVAHLIEQHYVDEKGVYHQDQGELRGVNLWCDPERIQNPQYLDEGYYEIKFKMPNVQGTSFAMFIYSAEEEKDLILGHENEKNYAYTEVDFCEIKPVNNGKSIEPLGGLHVSNVKTRKKISGGFEYNDNTWFKTIPTSKEWFDKWHTLQVILEKNTLKIYYDGVYFKTASVPRAMGGLKGKYGLFVRPEYCDYDWEDNSAKYKVDWSDESKHDFQVDYIRYYTLKK